MKRGLPRSAIAQSRYARRLPVGLGIILFVSFSSCSCTKKQDLTRCRTDIETLLRIVERYTIETGSVPDTNEGLEILVRKGYLKYVPCDPWGKPYNYRALDLGDNKYRVSITSRVGQERELFAGEIQSNKGERDVQRNEE